MAPPKRLILWDVDRTLINTGGVGGECFAAAYHEVTGRILKRSPQADGHTEPDLFLHAARMNAHPVTMADFVTFSEALAAEYERRRGDLAKRGKALPGARAALETLGKRRSVQTVVTGNVRDVARLKLEVFGLADLLTLEAGAYGSEMRPRRALVKAAIQRASRQWGVPFDQASTILIDDSVAGIKAGAGLAYTIGVATGRASEDDLQTAEASLVIGSLEELAFAQA